MHWLPFSMFIHCFVKRYQRHNRRGLKCQQGYGVYKNKHFDPSHLCVVGLNIKKKYMPKWSWKMPDSSKSELPEENEGASKQPYLANQGCVSLAFATNRVEDEAKGSLVFTQGERKSCWSVGGKTDWLAETILFLNVPPNNLSCFSCRKINNFWRYTFHMKLGSWW